MTVRLHLLHRTLLPIVLLGLGSLAVTAAAGAASRFKVSQQFRAFTVRDIQIAAGDTIAFSNEDDFTHQIYIDSSSMTFESDEQNPGESVNVTFTKAGLFAVRCHIHPKMLLNVSVR